MVAMPAAMPVIVPRLPDPNIAAMVVGDMVHEPPVVASLTVTTEPTQMKNEPVIAAGSGVTVIVVVR
jgi:hypothetical protein